MSAIRGINYFMAFKNRSATEIAADMENIARLKANYVALCLPVAQDSLQSDGVFLPYAVQGYQHPALPSKYVPSRWYHYPLEEEIRVAMEWAHAFGLQVMLKPHVEVLNAGITVNGQSVSLPQAITPSSAQWYRAWEATLSFYACNYNFDAICVGTELSGAFKNAAEWQKILAQLKSRCTAQWGHAPKLTAAFNWWTPLLNQRRWQAFFVKLFGRQTSILRSLIQYSGIRLDMTSQAEWLLANNLINDFHDWISTLDMLGINAYFPLSDSRSPSTEEIEASWNLRKFPMAVLGANTFNFLEELNRWSVAFRKPLTVTEIGFISREYCAKFPQNWAAVGAEDDEGQANAMKGSLKSLRKVSLGEFVWEWNESVYLPQGSPIMQAIKECWS